MNEEQIKFELKKAEQKINEYYQFMSNVQAMITAQNKYAWISAKYAFDNESKKMALTAKIQMETIVNSHLSHNLVS